MLRRKRRHRPNDASGRWSPRKRGEGINVNLALFGGTFNPLHFGHLLMAEAAREAFHLDHVIFLPTAQPPHKAVPRTSGVHRLAMLRLGLRGNPAFRVSDWEIRQNRVVYTYETLAHFRRQDPRASWFFLVGSDSLRDLPKWRQGEALLKQTTFLVFERPDVRWGSIPVRLRRRIKRVPGIPVAYASRDIRNRARQGASIRYYVPDAVASYIAARRLYRRAE
jgi:nicotinate-nucleotide adenylyltransferase